MIDPLRILPHNLRKRFPMRRLREQIQPRRRYGADHKGELRPPIFLIGFHKNGTTSIGAWFEDAGIRTKLFGGYAVKNNVAARMFSNFSTARPLLTGIEGYELYADLGYTDGSIHLEAARLFREMHRDYPQAYFILNTRPLADWVRSRHAHSKGRYVHRMARGLALSDAELREVNENLHRRHHDEVRAYFATQPDARFLEFDIAADPASRIVEFLAPDYNLDASRFEHRNPTPARVSALVQKGT